MVRRVVCRPSAVSCWRSIALRLIMVRRVVYRPSAVSCWCSISLRLIMVRRGVCRPFCGSASTLPPCVGIDLPFRLFSVYFPAVVSFRRAVRSCRPAGVLLPCVGNCPPLRLWFVPAVLLAFYCRALVIVRRCVCGSFLRFC